MSDDANLNPTQRAATIVALAASGISQRDIAKRLGISRSTVQRDLEDVKPSVEHAKDLVKAYNDQFDKLYTIEESALDYVDQAKNDKNGAVKLAARQRIDDLRGIITDKERLRTRSGDQPANQPMFVFQAGAKIDFGGLTVQRSDTPYIDVSPEKRVSDNGHVADSE